jgi:hypothetical protein
VKKERMGKKQEKSIRKAAYVDCFARYLQYSPLSLPLIFFSPSFSNISKNC